MKHLLLTFAMTFMALCSFAQLSQNVRGKVVDNETNFPLLGVKIRIMIDSSRMFRATTNEAGEFEIKDVPVGKHELEADLISYDTKTVTITVNTGKETIVQLALGEAYVQQVEEVSVTARRKGQTQNELSFISSQQFSVEETDRYPGSRADPARMASNFAGVQGADDSRNDIVVRGNSPLGIVWRVEGIDIPNPSHFAVSGSSGGPVSILNNKILANSDFFMSAFPAEYGNSISGIFDLKLRNGNEKMHELTGQFGFLGTELMAEGPLSKNKKSSYLAMARYSTLSIFKSLGIQIGTDAVPTYGDMAFKLNWELKNGGSLSWFAIGGTSDIAIKISDQKEYSAEFYGEGDRDQYFGTTMGVSGLVYKKPLSEKTLIQATAAVSYERQTSHHNYLVRSLDTTFSNGEPVYNISVDSIYPLMGYSFRTTRLTGYFALTHKFNKYHLIKAGINLEGQYMKMKDSVLNLDETAFIQRWNYKGTAALIQSFVQWKWRMRENMDFTAGLHAQYYSFSNSLSPAEPRVGWKWRLKKAQSVSAGAGLHSQTQPIYTYTYQKFDASGNHFLHNQNMDLTKSIQSALAYEKYFKGNLQVKTEVYYQHLYNVPVSVTPSSFSLINQGSGFQRFFPDSLKNTGTGRNYGVELTIQKFFNKSFFFLVTASLYESKYKGSDGIERNTSYNGNYATNFLAGKEFKLTEKQSISAGLKVTWAGGRRYGYADRTQSELRKEVIFSDSAFNERQFKDYFRLDLKVNWKFNARKMTHEIGLDLVNVLNTKNMLGLAYAPNLADPAKDPFAVKQQLGFLPIFYYKVDFRIGKTD